MPAIARLTIRLDKVVPKVERRVEVPVDIGLADLHLVIQAAMGWENCHLYEFRFGRNRTWGIPDPDWPDDLMGRADKSSLADVMRHLKKDKTFRYVYDFGDDWLHKIEVAAVGEAEAGATYPRHIAAKGACPPEDSGGPGGYARYLQAIADPEHPRHEEMIDWRGPGFDPAAVDEAGIRAVFARLAKHRRSLKTGS